MVPEFKKEHLRAAIYEGLRWWVNFDGPQLEVIRKQDGHLRADDVKRISRAYGFARNLSGDPVRAERTAKRINELARENWNSLADRLTETQSAIEDIYKIQGTRFRPVSGVTKLAWFAAPKGWTPFDSYASKAVGIRSYGKTVVRMRSYYEEIERRGFFKAADEIEKILASTPLKDVGGVRILDKYLMLGSDSEFAKDTRSFALNVQGALPTNWSSEIEQDVRRVVEETRCYVELA